MEFPSVIRFPMEKVCFYNKKAFMANMKGWFLTMRKILALMLAAVMAVSMTGCVQSQGGNSVVEEKFETGVRTDGDNLVVNYEEDQMQATITFVYTDDAVSDIKPQLNNVAFNYTNAAAPVVGYAKFRGGKAIYANICRDAEGYCMVITPIEMLDVKEDSFKKSMRGWFKPSTTVADLLECLSIYGATHHSLLIYDASVEEIEYFATLLGMKVITL